MNQVTSAIMVVVGIVSLIGGATFAYFNDTETSTGNTITAGSIDLKLSDPNEWPPSDGVTATWTFEDMKPGDSVFSYVFLWNYGDSEADHVEINVSNEVIDPPGPESDTEENTTDMDKEMILTLMFYDGINCLNLLNDTNGNGYKDLDDLETQGLDNLKPVPPANGMGTQPLLMEIKFNENADNDYQGDILNMTMRFTLNQHPSQ